MKYQLALFDFDGTLADTLPWFAGMMNEVADRFGFRRVEPGELDLLRGLDNRGIIRHLGVPMWKVPLIAAHMRARMAEQIDQLRLFEGTLDALRALQAGGVTVGIVSSNAEANIRRVLGAEMADSIRLWGCGASLFGKPAKLRKVLAQSGVEPGRAIYVGDEIRDVEAAREVGVASGAVCWGYNTAEALAARSPTALFTTFDELCACITVRA